MEMSKTNLKVKRLIRFDGEGSLKAFCDLAIADTFLIKGLRVIEGRGGLFVSMPRQQGRDSKWYETAVALTEQAEEELQRVVLAAYHEQNEMNQSAE